MYEHNWRCHLIVFARLAPFRLNPKQNPYVCCSIVVLSNPITQGGSFFMLNRVVFWHHPTRRGCKTRDGFKGWHPEPWATNAERVSSLLVSSNTKSFLYNKLWEKLKRCTELTPCHPKYYPLGIKRFSYLYYRINPSS